MSFIQKQTLPWITNHSWCTKFPEWIIWNTYIIGFRKHKYVSISTSWEKGKTEMDVIWTPSSKQTKRIINAISSLFTQDLSPVLNLSLKVQFFCLWYSWIHKETLRFLKTEPGPAPPHLQQPASSVSSRQSLVPSHLQDRGIHCPSSQRKCSLSHSGNTTCKRKAV